MDVNDLYKKVDEFDNRIRPEAKALSQCRSGCSRCCYTDISVFSVEADNIRQWFSQLTISQQSDLWSKWSQSLAQKMNFRGDTVSSCTFLHDEHCTIYEARPLICRTQGMAFRFREDSEEYVDVCTLNDGMLDELLDSEFVNLDLLNSILGAMAGEGERVSLMDLRKVLFNSKNSMA